MDARTNNLSSPSPSPSVIIGPQFCSPFPQQLAFPEELKVPGLELKSLCAIDIVGRLIFTTTEPPFLSANHRTVLIDAATGTAIVSIQKKIMDPRGIWEVYSGISNEPNYLLFSVERTSAFQIITELNVYLASNVTKEIPDFRIDGGYKRKTCKVYRGNSSTIVAQMCNGSNFTGMQLDKDDVVLCIEPGMDSAFLAALVVIRHAFHVESKKMLLSLVFSGGTSGAVPLVKMGLRRLM